MATKLNFSGNNPQPSQRVQVKDGQVKPVVAAKQIKTSTVSPKEHDNGKG